MRSKDVTLSPDANLIVRNLSKEIDQSQLMTMFKEFGKIVSCKLETDNKGESKGYGYVQFEKADDAKTAIEKMNGKEVGTENKKKIDVNVHKKLDQRDHANADRYTNLVV